MDEDVELLRRYAADGSESAFAQLVQRNVDLVYSAALRRLRGDTHAASDVTQEVFTALAVQARSLRQCRALPAWLYATTRNVAVDFIRTEQRRRSREREAHIMHELTADSRDTRDTDQVRLLVDTAMDELSETDRVALVMRFFARRSLAEIGAVLNITEDAARMRVNRALEKLQLLLSRRGVTSSALALSSSLTEQATLAAPAGLAATIGRAAVQAGVAAAHGTWFGFESGKAGATILSVALICTSGSLAVKQWQELKLAENALAAGRADVFALGSRLADVERHTKESLRTLALRRPDSVRPDQLETLSPEKEVNGPFGPKPPGSRARGRALMAAYPELQRLVVEEKRAYFAERYRQLYDDLGLTRSEIDAFEHLMIAGVSSTYGSGERTVTLDAAPPISWPETETKLKQLLGEGRFVRFQQFQKTQGSRATSLASMLYFTDHPLTAAQAGKFQQVVSELARIGGAGQRPAEYWSAVRARAAEFLSPDQLIAVRALEANDEFNFARMQNQKLRTAANPGP